MERLTVIGSGTMGHSIALSAAWSGVVVRMYGLTHSDTETGMSGIRKKLEVLVINELILPTEADEIVTNITTTNSLDDAIEGSDFIIECIPEDITLKNSLFRQLDLKCDANVILASNTSGLRLSDILQGTKHPERIIIAHFWNPAHLIPLVEVLRSPQTREDVFSRTMALLQFMGKKAIEVRKEVPGLVGNRLQFALFREAQHLLDQGIATKEDIDAAVTFGIGRRLPATGPLMSADMGGLDVFKSVSDNLFKSISNANESYSALNESVAAGKYGDKSGEGYYKWNEAFSAKMNGLREKELIRLIKADRDEQGQV
ncbi:MAG: 3-hydroxyacyl-CoA dehydrogenase family protein [Bacteroidota bacterium]